LIENKNLNPSPPLYFKLVDYYKNGMEDMKGMIIFIRKHKNLSIIIYLLFIFYLKIVDQDTQQLRVFHISQK
jgi:hypothetical protein